MNTLNTALITLTSLIAFSSVGNAASITYEIQNYPADQNGANLSGSITTDGKIGDLAVSDITSWNFLMTFSDGSQVAHDSSDSNAYVTLFGTVVATQTEITIGTGPNLFGLTVTTYSGPAFQDFLGYDRIDEFYTGSGGKDFWQALNPTFGVVDPWVIAVAPASVPEPASIALVGMGTAGLLAFGLNCRRVRKSA